MTEILKGQIEVADQIACCKVLLAEVGERLKAVLGAVDAEEAARLPNELRGHIASRTKVDQEIERKRRPKIGDSVPVVRYEYDDRSDYFHACHEKGIVTEHIGDDGIVVRIPEQIFPKRIIPERIIPKQIIAKKIIAEHLVRAEWFELTEEWVDGKSDENWDDALLWS